MTEALYMNDMTMKEFDANIVSVTDGKFVVLDKTAFYPKSGGVDCDIGIMIDDDGNEHKVIFVGKFSGSISHQIESPDGVILKEGQVVHCKIDWARRYKLMRYHSAAHVLSGVFAKDAGALITGNNLTLEKGRIDFDLDDFDKDGMQKYIDKANDLISQDLRVDVYSMKRSDVEANPNLCKLAKGLPPGIDNLRIVDIVNFDAQPDGGAHVASLKEIGNIVYLKAENKGAQNRRVYFRIEP